MFDRNAYSYLRTKVKLGSAHRAWKGREVNLGVVHHDENDRDADLLGRDDLARAPWPPPYVLRRQDDQHVDSGSNLQISSNFNASVLCLKMHDFALRLSKMRFSDSSETSVSSNVGV